MPLFLAALLLAATPPSPPWERAPFGAPPAAVAAAAAALPASQEKDLDLLLLEKRQTFEAGGKVSRVVRMVFRPLSVEGVRSNSVFSVPWLPWYQERPTLRARVVTSNGGELHLDPATVTDGPAGQLSPGQFTDARLLHAPLPGIEVGAVVEVEIRSREQDPLPGGGTVWSLSFAAGPARRASAVVDAPVDLPLRHRAHGLGGLGEAPAVVVANERRTLRWDWAPGPGPARAEPDEPLDGIPGAWLAISTGTSWSAFAAAYAAVVETQLAGADVAALAREIVPGASGRDEAAARILAWMRERLRYTGLELGASAMVPARPAEVLARRYGDCKDLSLLFAALMRALGHEAHLALVRAQPGEIASDLPGWGAFDHAIVSLGGDRPAWIDPTFPELPVGLIPAHLEGKLALVARPGATGLAALPFNPASAYQIDLEREIRMPKAGRATVKEVASVSGVPAAIDRMKRRGASRDQLRAAELKEARERLGTDDVTSETEAPDNGPFVERRTGSGSPWGTATDDAAEAQLEPRPLRCLPESLLPWNEQGKADRRGPVQVFLPCTFEQRYRVVPASGLRPVQPLPAPFHLLVGPVRLDATYQAGPDGSLTARIHLDLTRGQLTAEQVKQIRTELRGLGKDGPKARFERTSRQLLDAGRGREALDEIRRLITAEPAEVGHQVRLAMALLSLGLGEPARAAARQAVAMAPTSAWAQRVMSFVLEADLVGRHLEVGCDLPGAVAAQRKAVELEPDNIETRARLGSLLLRGEGCRLFGRGANPAEAAALLQQSPRTIDQPVHANNLMRALLAIGKDVEVVELARKQPRARYRDSILLAALALSEGAPVAAKEAERLTPAERGETVRWATIYLSHRRAYALAADLLQTGTAGAENVARYQASADQMRRVQRLAEHPPGRSTPEGLAAALARAGADLEPIEGLLAEARGRAGLEAPRRFARLVAEAVSGEVPPEVVADLAAALTLKWESDGADGGRLVLGPVAVYLTKEGGDWKLLAFYREYGEITRRALRLLASGQPEVARRWLAWCLKDRGSEGEWHSTVIAPLVVGPEGSLEALRLLAVVLGGFLEGGAEGDAVLKSALARDLSPAARAAVRLFQGYRRLETKDYPEALAAAEAVLRDLPGSAWSQALRLRALAGLGRLDEVRRLAAAARTDAAQTPEALRTLASVAAREGALAEGIALAERLEEVAAPTPADLNNLAWQRLYLDEVPSSARTDAQRAVDRSSRADPLALHTLATVLAETGEPEQAAATLRKVVAEHGDGLHDSDWLVVGRIAQAYGLASDARAAYQRIEKPQGALGLAPWTLAQRWNARLDASASRPAAEPAKATPAR